MKQTVTFSTFLNAFEHVRPNNFSYEGLGSLFGYLMQYEADTGEELELDVIALCCDYSEKTWQEIANDYDIDLSECDDGICTASAYGLEQVESAKIEAVREYLIENTQIINETANGFIYQEF